MRKVIKILELNGVSSEPGHVYDTETHHIFKAYKSIKEHWKIIGEIASLNMKSGIKPVSALEVLKVYLKFAFN